MIKNLCKFNLSIIIKIFRQTSLTKVGIVDLDESKNEIIGLFGSKMNSIFGRNPLERLCRLVGAEGLGIKSDPSNHSFSGALGLLQNGKGDLILESLSRQLQKPFFSHSHPSSQT